MGNTAGTGTGMAAQLQSALLLTNTSPLANQLTYNLLKLHLWRNQIRNLRCHAHAAAMIPFPHHPHPTHQWVN